MSNLVTGAVGLFGGLALALGYIACVMLVGSLALWLCCGGSILPLCTDSHDYSCYLIPLPGPPDWSI